MTTRTHAVVISLVALALAVSACRGRRPTPGSADGGLVLPQPDSLAAAPSPLSGGGLMAMSSLFSAQLEEPGPYDERRKSEDFAAGDDHFVVVDLSGDVVELKEFSMWGGGGGTELRSITDKLSELRANEKVKGIILRLTGQVGIAHAEELRRALVAFRGSGEDTRELHCYAETAMTWQYYLMTACNSIGLAPIGMLSITGVSLTPVHLKGLLDRHGVQADFVHVGAYKGAAEPLTLPAPSPQMRETLGGILDGAYATLIGALVEGRGLAEDRATALVDTALFDPEAALESGLINSVARFADFRDTVVGERGWRRIKLGKDTPPDFTELMKFIGMTPQTRTSDPHVALVYAVGNVVDGKGDGVIGARSNIASRTLVSALDVLAEDENVKAVVLRVNSPGGSALASELIWKAVGRVKDRKPVVVSMAGVAASGGYYISAGATKIYSLANTMTGSIGVVGGKITWNKALDRYGIKSFPMGRGARSQLWSAMQPWSKADRAVVQSMMDSVYDVFVDRVSKGRNKSVAEVKQVAQGRVWTGAAAKENGLVDDIGTLEDALREARALAGVEVDAPLEVYPPEPVLRDIMAQFGGVSARASVTENLDLAAEVVGAVAASALGGLVDQVLSFNRATIQTTALMPWVLE